MRVYQSIFMYTKNIAIFPYLNTWPHASYAYLLKYALKYAQYVQYASKYA